MHAGDPRRAQCPLPGCGAALPSAAAARLLLAPALRRFEQLLAQRYLIAHPETMRCCPQAACGAMLHLASGEPAAAAAAAPSNDSQAAAAEGSSGGGPPAAAEPPLAGAAPGAGLDAECGACGHRLCWRCGEEAHEPASCAQVGRGVQALQLAVPLRCSAQARALADAHTAPASCCNVLQMQQWSDELAALRRAAPDADRQWLAANTKRCPQCRAHIQASHACSRRACLPDQAAGGSSPGTRSSPGP